MTGFIPKWLETDPHDDHDFIVGSNYDVDEKPLFVVSFTTSEGRVIAGDFVLLTRLVSDLVLRAALAAVGGPVDGDLRAFATLNIKDWNYSELKSSFASRGIVRNGASYSIKRLMDKLEEIFRLVECDCYGAVPSKILSLFDRKLFEGELTHIELALVDPANQKTTPFKINPQLLERISQWKAR